MTAARKSFAFLPSPWYNGRSWISGYSEAGIAPGLGVPWRYPGRVRAKRRKALRRLRLRDFPRLLKAAQKRLWPQEWPQTEKTLFLPLAVVSWQKSEYPGVAQLVGRDIWDVEVGCSSHLTRTKIPLKSTISEGFFLFFVYCGAEFEFVILNISFRQFLCKAWNDYTSYQIVLYF